MSLNIWTWWNKYELEQIPPVGGAPQANEKFEELEAMVDAEDAKMAKRLDAAGVAAVFFAETESFFSAREERVNHAPLELDVIFAGILVVLGLLTVLCVLLMPATSAPWLKYAQSLSVAVASGFDAGPDFVCGLQQFHGAAGRASAGAH